MSMLQKILQDMYVEPELLDELDEEQKQILFCKMREEQLRRWAEGEKQWEHMVMTNTLPPKGNKRNVQWLTDAAGEPWVWVMGEHQDDKTIDEIMDEETQEAALRLAEEEIETVRKIQEEQLKETLRLEPVELYDHADTPVVSGIQTISTSNAGSHTEQLFKETSMVTSNAPETNGEVDSVSETDAIEMQALLESLKQAKLTIRSQGKRTSRDNDEKELQKEREALETRLREEAERRIDTEKERRRLEIYESLKEARQRRDWKADDELQRLFRQQEQKSKAAESEIRSLARKAREEHRRHASRTTSSILSALAVHAPPPKYPPPAT